MDDEKVIQAVQRRTSLYDKNDPKYTNREVVRRLWLECAAEVKASAEAVKKRWNHLRDYYMKQHRHMQLVRSGQALPRRRKKWPLYDAMAFLIPYITHREPYPSMVVEEGVDAASKSEGDRVVLGDDAHETSYTILSDTTPDIQQELRRSPKKNNSSHARYHPYQSMKSPASCKIDLECLKELREPREIDDNEHFFLSLLPMVRKLDPVATMEFRMEVQAVLLRYMKQQASNADADVAECLSVPLSVHPSSAQSSFASSSSYQD